MKRITDWLIMTLGCVMVAVGIYFFKLPNGFATGGVSGLATVLSPMVSIPTPTIIFIINIFLLVVGFVFLGKANGVRTVFCTLLYSGIMILLEQLVPVSAPLTDQPLLELVYGIMLVGVGSALIFRFGASTGGTDIVALILRKYTSLDVGKSLLAVDSLISFSSFFVFGVKIGLFSLAGLFAKSFLVDGVIESFDTCKYFMVVTTHPDDIAEYITKTMHHSATMMRATGAYTNDEKTVLHTVCRRLEAVRLQRIVRQVDPDAFMIITSSSEIIGRGFRDA